MMSIQTIRSIKLAGLPGLASLRLSVAAAFGAAAFAL